MSKDSKLALIVTERKPFGYLLVPYIIDCSLSPIIRLSEQITPTYFASHKSSFSEIEQSLLTNLIELHEQKLYKHFSKERTVKAFYEKLTQETIDRFISPFIDHIIKIILPIITRNDIPIYLKDSGYFNTNESKHIIINKFQSKPRFFFTLSDKGFLSYKLKIANNGCEFSLYEKQIKELSINPAVLIIDNQLYYFEDIDAKKFRNFTHREHLIYDSSKIEMVMGSFVRKCIEQYHVSCYGFNIERNNITCKPILSIKNSPWGFVFCLSFAYDKQKYSYNQLKKVVNLRIDNGKYTFVSCQRDTKTEEHIVNQLAEIGLHTTESEIMQCDTIEKSQTAYPLIKWLNTNFDYIHECGIETQTIEISGYYTGSIDLQMRINDKIDWFDIYGTVILDGYEIPFIKLRNNIINGTQEYILPDGKIFIIPDEWFATWSDIFNLATKSSETLRLEKIHSTFLPPEMMDFDVNKDTLLVKSQTLRQGQLLATLRPYQDEGFRWLLTLYENNRGGILADDMGLGKTLQTIALLSHIYATKPLAETHIGEFNFSNSPTTDSETSVASLIVVPVSLVHNWINELKRFAPHLYVCGYTHRNRQNSLSLAQMLTRYHVIITSYGHLRNDIDIFSKYQFNYLIADESQYAKNPTSKTYKSLTEIDAKYHLNLSGTPIENKLNDLWTQMNIVNRGLLGNQTFFNNYFNIPITKNHDEQREEKLRRAISPFILRRTKEMVAKDLPPITEQTINCLMSDEQREIYEREKSSFRNEILCNRNSDIKVQSFMALQAMMRMRLIANHPALVNPDYTGTSGKFDIIIDNIRNVANEGHKMLIFSSFVRDLELIATAIKSENIDYSMLTGCTTNRESVINDFTKSSKKVFLISLKAGGVGLNLTCADYVFVLNPWWNPKAEEQAISRAHRIGQTKNVFVYRFITTDTIEEKIQMLQQQKNILSDKFVQTNNPLSNLTADQIKDLIL